MDGVFVAEHGRLSRRETSDGSVRVISWLCIFFDKVGDRMPMSAAIHLPSCLTKFNVYLLAYDDLSQAGMQCCELSTFYDIWQKQFPSVKIPKVISLLGRIVYSCELYLIRRVGSQSVMYVQPSKRVGKGHSILQCEGGLVKFLSSTSI